MNKFEYLKDIDVVASFMEDFDSNDRELKEIIYDVSNGDLDLNADGKHNYHVTVLGEHTKPRTIKINFIGDGDGHLYVTGNGGMSSSHGDLGVSVYRTGKGNGHVFHDGIKTGDVYNKVAGYGDSIRGGDGHAFRDNGDGNAVHLLGDGHAVKRGSRGNGHAIRESMGDGDAVMRGDGVGDAIKRGYGRGHAIKSGIGDGNAIKKGKGEGNAEKTGPGKGDAYHDGVDKGAPIHDGKGEGESIQEYHEIVDDKIYKTNE